MALGTKFFRKVMADSLPLHVGQIDHTPMVHHCHFENKFKFAYFEIGSWEGRSEMNEVPWCVKLRFWMRNAELYSFRIADE